MATHYNLDGSIDLVDDLNPERQLHVPGPKNGQAQLEAMEAFYDPEGPNDSSI